MNGYLRKARRGETDAVYALVEQRIHWMDAAGIHQWNDTDYLSYYPKEYYVKNLDKLYVLAQEETERILCAAVILRADDRWASDEPAFYIHNFVSAADAGGAGERFLRLLEEAAAREGAQWLRLDSAEDNPKLAAYYERHGFAPCGVCEEGDYHGTLRQKRVKG